MPYSVADVESWQQRKNCDIGTVKVWEVPMYKGGQSVRKMNFNDLTDKQKALYVQYKEAFLEELGHTYETITENVTFEDHYDSFINFLIVEKTARMEDFAKSLEHVVYDIKLYLIANANAFFHKYLTDDGQYYIMEGNQIILTGAPCATDAACAAPKAKPARKSCKKAKRISTVRRKPAATGRRELGDWEEEVREMICRDREARDMWDMFVDKYLDGDKF